jgi:hypothetical protein
VAYSGFLDALVVRESLDYFYCLYRIVGSSVVQSFVHVGSGRRVASRG